MKLPPRFDGESRCRWPDRCSNLRYSKLRRMNSTCSPAATTFAMDGLGMVLVSRRIAAIYSALVAGEPVPPSYFGSLNDLVEGESAYEASPDYLEDRNYWSTHLPPTTQRTTGLRSSPRGMTAPHRPCRSRWIPPSSGRPKELSRRYASGGTRCSPLRAPSWCVHIAPETRWRSTSRSAGGNPGVQDTSGMLAGVVPLVSKDPPNLSVAEFCRDVTSYPGATAASAVSYAGAH